MNINLADIISHPDATMVRYRYARVDNTSNPTWISVPDKVVSSVPTSIVIATNIPNGRYAIEATPIYPDGRTCNPDIEYTPDCPVLEAINAYIQTSNIVVTWTAPVGVQEARITIRFPNGGEHVQNYINSAPTNTITIPIPNGNVGNFYVSGQSVCDSETGFYSAQSASVVLSNEPDTPSVGTSTVVIENNTTDLTIDNVFGIPGFVASNVFPGTSRVGFRNGNTTLISVYYNDELASGKAMRLFVNEVQYQCVNLTDGSNSFIIPFGLTGSEDIRIVINNTVC